LKPLQPLENVSKERARYREKISEIIAMSGGSGDHPPILHELLFCVFTFIFMTT
jgi:hypothetical protein